MSLPRKLWRYGKRGRVLQVKLEKPGKRSEESRRKNRTSSSPTQPSSFLVHYNLYPRTITFQLKRSNLLLLHAALLLLQISLTLAAPHGAHKFPAIFNLGYFNSDTGGPLSASFCPILHHPRGNMLMKVKVKV